MEEQKKTIIEFVQGQKVKGQSITESLKALGIKRSTYYTWLKPREEKKTGQNVRELTPFEEQAIEDAKEHYPTFVTDRFRGCCRTRVCIFP